MADADDIGHLVLLLVAGVCAWVFRGIPWWLWLVIYGFSAFVAPMAWKEKALTPARWLIGAIGFSGVTALLYRIGLGLIGSGEPWMIFKIPGLLVPVIALSCVSGFARGMYMRSRWTNGGKSGDRVDSTTAR
jgi:hypothetical protein